MECKTNKEKEPQTPVVREICSINAIDERN